MSQLLREGDIFVNQMQKQCVHLTTYAQRTEKVEQKQAKNDNLIKRFFGGNNKV